MKQISLDELLTRLSRKATTAPRLAQAMVELTYGCNLRCVHCYNPTHEATQERTTDEVLRTLDQLVEGGCFRVGFTGGELFTRRDAMEIMRYARRRGLLITILTNATMLTPTLADQIRALEPYQVDVSVYGATARTYEAVTRVPGSFARFVSGVDLLNDRGVPVMLKLVLLTTNVHEHDAMRELASARQLPYQVSTDVHPRVDGSLEPLAYRLAPEQAFEVWRRESGRRLREDASDSPCGSPRLAPADEVEARCLAADGLFHCRCGTSSAAVTPHAWETQPLSLGLPPAVRPWWWECAGGVAAARRSGGGCQSGSGLRMPRVSAHPALFTRRRRQLAPARRVRQRVRFILSGPGRAEGRLSVWRDARSAVPDRPSRTVRRVCRWTNNETGSRISRHRSPGWC